MLVLRRKPGETIRIGDDIIITVTECERGSARIGIDAPKEIAIVRGELKTEKAHTG